MQTITPFLWFDDQAEEAVDFYCSIFKNAKKHNVNSFGDEESSPAGRVTTISFELNGQDFIALNGGPRFKFTEAVSFMIACDTQQEVDDLWNRLSQGGEEGQCGWLKDKYGLSWQVVPAGLSDLLAHDDPKKAAAALQAMLKMRKLDIDELRRAADRA